MKDDLLTVAEYAEVEGITKQAIYSRMRFGNWREKHCKEIDGKVYIDLTTFEQKNSQIKDKRKDSQKIQELLLKLESKERENEILREQIAEKDQQIHSLIAGWRESQVSIMYQLTGKEGSPEDKVSDSEQSIAESLESPESDAYERRSVFDRLFKIRRK